jgi:FlaA1/EpsC-like NDP-sugar epimerase
MFTGKTLLISGGTGSFGNAVMRRFLGSDIGEIRVLSRDEKKQDDMRRRYANPKLKFYIGDVRDYQSVKNAMQGVDYVFNAAALKQVPAAEYNPIEFINTNVLGAENVVQACLDNGVRRVVALSTDKAAAPVNLYGATKLCSDKLFIAANNIKGKRNLRFSVVRYGNVMGSRGSVIPFFLEKAKTGVLPITDPGMTRFNISLSEGVNLTGVALQCFRVGEGEIRVAACLNIVSNLYDFSAR